jgi:hypothetical protein
MTRFGPSTTPMRTGSTRTVTRTQSMAPTWNVSDDTTTGVSSVRLDDVSDAVLVKHVQLGCLVGFASEGCSQPTPLPAMPPLETATAMYRPAVTGADIDHQNRPVRQMYDSCMPPLRTMREFVAGVRVERVVPPLLFESELPDVFALGEPLVIGGKLGSTVVPPLLPLLLSMSSLVDWQRTNGFFVPVKKIVPATKSRER